MNTFGTLFSFTTWGESHGIAVGCVIDGCPAGIQITEEDIDKELKNDVPNVELGTPRREINKSKILSGTYEGQTIGTPICIAIFNKNHKSNDYQLLKTCYRPGHAEYTYHKRYGIYNPLGGGRASGRECIARLAVGAVAKKLLALHNIKLESRLLELGGLSCLTEEEKEEAVKKCLETGKNGDSTGGVIELKIKGVPAGVGAPLFHKLHSLIIYAVSTIGGVKAVECGLGIEAAKSTGSQFNDEFSVINGEIITLSNNSGGVLGGISTGQELIFRIYVKPTPSIAKEQNTVDWTTMKETKIFLNGRFDINFAPRVGPVAEAMAAAVIVDQMMMAGHINPTKI